MIRALGLAVAVVIVIWLLAIFLAGSVIADHYDD